LTNTPPTKAMTTEQTKPTILRVPPTGEQGIFAYYAQGYYCGNCGTHQTVWILKGHRKPHSVECENCKCQTRR
jgi:hypothetical protein